MYKRQKRNGVEGLTAEAIGYENGVLGGVLSTLQAFASPGDAVLLHSPTYIGFTGCIGNYGYKMVHSPLKKDAEGIWRMDYEDMDAKIKEHHIHVAVFCNPHNPCGRVWERWEIEKAMEVYKANDCVVISDEIWSDLILSLIHIYHKMIVENSGLLTVAALKHLNVKGKKVVSVLSGGNMDVITMASVVQLGLIKRCV